MYPDWLDHIDEKRRENLLQILEELSKLQNRDDLNFIIIGALSLLFNNYLKYKVYWDIDMLFKDKNQFTSFIEKPKSKSLKIVNLDDTLMIDKNISSYHTVWAFDHIWFNVDYILRQGFFEYYAHTITQLKPYKERIPFGNNCYEIELYIAHPWDIIVEKVFSPRTARDLELKVDTSVDLRHIVAVYVKEKNNHDFWKHAFEKAKLLQGEVAFKTKFLRILDELTDFGYGDIEVSAKSREILRI
ncbi:MAG: DUF6036 family nucleotidyltransferase [bacterium]